MWPTKRPNPEWPVLTSTELGRSMIRLGNDELPSPPRKRGSPPPPPTFTSPQPVFMEAMYVVNSSSLGLLTRTGLSNYGMSSSIISRGMDGEVYETTSTLINPSSFSRDSLRHTTRRNDDTTLRPTGTYTFFSHSRSLRLRHTITVHGTHSFGYRSSKITPLLLLPFALRPPSSDSISPSSIACIVLLSPSRLELSRRTPHTCKHRSLSHQEARS